MPLGAGRLKFGGAKMNRLRAFAGKLVFNKSGLILKKRRGESHEMLKQVLVYLDDKTGTPTRFVWRSTCFSSSFKITSFVLERSAVNAL